MRSKRGVSGFIEALSWQCGVAVGRTAATRYGAVRNTRMSQDVLRPQPLRDGLP